MRKAEATDNVLFDRFWVAYPKKVGKEKARRAFEKLHPTEDLLGQMLEAIKATPCLFLEQGDLEIHSAPCNLAESKTMGG